MFGWRNTRTEQVTRSAVTPSGKYIWVEPTFGSQLNKQQQNVLLILWRNSDICEYYL